MADLLLEPRVINLEEMMAEMIRANQLTYERIMESLRESQQRSEEEYRLHREQVAEELRERQKQSDEQIHQHQERVAEELRQYRKRVADDLRNFEEKLDEGLQKHRAEWQAEQRRFNQELGGIAAKQGRIVEDLVAPSLPRILREAVPSDDDEEIAHAERVKRPHPRFRNTMQEYDVIVSGGGYALFNETKSTMKPSHIDALLKKLDKAREFFPEYESYKIIGSIASLFVDSSLVRYATRKGVLILAVGDELMDVMNGPDFKFTEF